ncbi:2-C-methyl-D-erythritol 4-phosphate cytidylyltransferase [Chloroflexota bacterium]
MTNQPKVSVIIVAAGESRRMNGVDKIFAGLGGKPVLARTISAFEGCGAVVQIVVVAAEANVKRCKQMVNEEGWTKVTDVCAGGARRQDSVKTGLDKIEKCDLVIIHDGARPLVSGELIARGVSEAGETGAAVPAVPVSDTIKVAGDDLIVSETPPRRNLWAVQTPQVFLYDIISRAYRQPADEVTDDSTLVERLGYKVKLYMGSYDNIKITTAQDLALAGVLLKKRQEK